MIEDLRVLSLKDSGHLEIQRTSVRLADELSTVLQAFAAPLTAKGFHLHNQLDANLRVECDALRIRQALMALLENALRHADPGNLRVRLEQVGDNCQLSVADDGPGIYSALAAADEPMTTAGLAERTGLDERWVREWAYNQAAARLITCDDDERFGLPKRRDLAFVVMEKAL